MKFIFIYIFELIILTVFLFFSIGCFSQVNKKYDVPKTNLEIFQILTENISDSIIINGNINRSDLLNIIFLQKPDSWVVEHSMINYFQDKYNIRIITDSDSITQNKLECAIINMGVVYNDVHRNGLFGYKKIVRSLQLDLSCKLKNNKSNIFAHSFKEAYKDTILLNEINNIENININSTKGNLPEESYLDRFISPIVIVSTTAVIIYLFFTLRK